MKMQHPRFAERHFFLPSGQILFQIENISTNDLLFPCDSKIFEDKWILPVASRNFDSLSQFDTM